MESIRNSVSGVSSVTVSTPLSGNLGLLSYQGRKTTSIAFGVGFSYQELNGVYTDKGRFFQKATSNTGAGWWCWVKPWSVTSR